MIKTSTLNTLTEKAKKQKEKVLPEFIEPNDKLITSILNFSKSLDVKKSSHIREFTIIKS